MVSRPTMRHWSLCRNITQIFTHGYGGGRFNALLLLVVKKQNASIRNATTESTAVPLEAQRLILAANQFHQASSVR
ncbi:hypothetical protein KCP75_19935 [Salmonella enterica subsp. enterica]|nr:hypothetical protein KCP75_19935 [Salmonella enterica subsp. enterica]